MTPSPNQKQFFKAFLAFILSLTTVSLVSLSNRISHSQDTRSLAFVDNYSTDPTTGIPPTNCDTSSDQPKLKDKTTCCQCILYSRYTIPDGIWRCSSDLSPCMQSESQPNTPPDLPQISTPTPTTDSNTSPTPTTCEFYDSQGGHGNVIMQPGEYYSFIGSGCYYCTEDVQLAFKGTDHCPEYSTPSSTTPTPQPTHTSLHKPASTSTPTTCEINDDQINVGEIGYVDNICHICTEDGLDPIMPQDETNPHYYRCYPHDLPACHADTNQNGFVTLEDFFLLIKFFGPTNTSHTLQTDTHINLSLADSNSNSFIDIQDILFVFQHIGDKCPSNQYPN